MSFPQPFMLLTKKHDQPDGGHFMTQFSKKFLRLSLALLCFIYGPSAFADPLTQEEVDNIKLANVILRYTGYEPDARAVRAYVRDVRALIALDDNGISLANFIRQYAGCGPAQHFQSQPVDC